MCSKGKSAITSSPPPSGIRIDSSPPACTARARIPTSPIPLPLFFFRVIPFPLSATRNRTLPAGYQLTSPRWPACRAMFVRASCAYGTLPPVRQARQHVGFVDTSRPSAAGSVRKATVSRRPCRNRPECGRNSCESSRIGDGIIHQMNTIRAPLLKSARRKRNQFVSRPQAIAQVRRAIGETGAPPLLLPCSICPTRFNSFACRSS